MYIFAPHSFLHYTINTRYDRRQLSYQQRTCVHNAFDDIREYTIECDDPLETKGIVAEIKRRWNRLLARLYQQEVCIKKLKCI